MKKTLILLLAASLAGCASYNAPTSNEGHALKWDQRRAELASLKQWKASGAISVRNDQKGWNASFNWEQQNPNNYVLNLFGPLGTNHIQLARNNNGATLITPQRTVSAPNVETLLTQQLGYELPVSSLYYWMRGMPIPTIHSRQAFDMNNRIGALTQEGWDIKYLSYTHQNGVDLPDRMLLTKTPWVVHVNIHEWNIG